MTTRLNDFHRHPCFNADVKGECGRIHLPVAPKCNIKCNYCNRKHDCVNESRPGVCSAVLTPQQAVKYLGEALEREPRITVAGIAGPGDPFATPLETIETMRLVKERFPEMILCLATNGFGALPYLDDIASVGVSHVTVTVNTVDPEIGKNIYGWARDGKIIYRGLRAAELLLERQLEVIAGLKERGVIVKVNTIVVPGINDRHVEEVARKMAELGVDLLNCMPMYPNEDTPFESIPEPSKEQMESLQETAGKYLPQMKHCTRCRADAVGLLGEDRSDELSGCLESCSRAVPSLEDKPYVAVASLEGMLINQHLGEARRFLIWEQSDYGYKFVEERPAPEPGNGLKRWVELSAILKDCRAVLVSGFGENPAKVLREAGIMPVEMNGFIEMGLDLIYKGGNVTFLKTRKAKACSKGQGCGGDGGGCM